MSNRGTLGERQLVGVRPLGQAASLRRMTEPPADVWDEIDALLETYDGDIRLECASKCAWSAQVRYAGRRLVEALQDPAAGEPPLRRVRVRVGRP